MARLSIVSADEQEAQEVDLWGSVFVAVPMTQHRRLKIAEIVAKAEREAALVDKDIQEAEVSPLDEDYVEKSVEITKRVEDVVIDVIASAFDVALAAVDGGKKKPSTVVKQANRDGKRNSDYDSLTEFLSQIGASTRPT